MHYKDLHELIQKSLSSRKFFLSLPIETQYRLHKHNAYIHSAAQLHSRLNAIQDCTRLEKLGKWDTTNKENRFFKIALLYKQRNFLSGLYDFHITVLRF